VHPASQAALSFIGSNHASIARYAAVITLNLCNSGDCSGREPP